MSLYNSRVINLKKPPKVNLTLNIPRYISFKENQEITVVNDQFNFSETYFYLKGEWLLILKNYRDGIYLSKKIIKQD